MTFDELLDLVPGLRRCRSLNTSMVRVLLDRRRGECTWCGKTVPKGRKTWCGDQCIEVGEMRWQPVRMAGYVHDRDKGICQICGRNTKQAERDYHLACNELKKQHPIDLHQPFTKRHPDYYKKQQKLATDRGFSGDWGQADHIIPVSEGGGLCGPENMRWVCGTCHKAETAKLRKRLKRK